MTYKEKLIADHPEWEDSGKLGETIRLTCPRHYYNATIPHWCHRDSTEEDCIQCWNRVMEPESKIELTPKEKERIDAYVTDLKELIAEVAMSDKGPHIKDSGDRTQFESGAVRDMREGKGRCDLMPLEVVADVMVDERVRTMFENIVHFQRTNDTGFLKACLINFAEAYRGDSTDCRYTPEVCTMFLEVAKHFEEGAKKYGESNWTKGIPIHCYIDSAVRHYLKWLRGDKDEPHDRAFVWNLMCCIWEVDYGEEVRKQIN